MPSQKPSHSKAGRRWASCYPADERLILVLAQQSLSTGKQALQVALTTLDTLRQSRTLQQQLLDVARQTVQQTQEINKIPGPPVFPAAATSPGP